MVKQSFIADEEEKERAHAIFINQKLFLNDMEYLKDIERRYGESKRGLYDGLTKVFKKHSKSFATHEFSRQTMNVEPARLGIKEEHRDKQMRKAQYPLNAEQRLSLIHISEPTRLGMISYAVFCFKKKKNTQFPVTFSTIFRHTLWKKVFHSHKFHLTN